MVKIIVYINEKATSLESFESFDVEYQKVFATACAKPEIGITSDIDDANISNYDIRLYESENDYKAGHCMSENYELAKDNQISDILTTNDQTVEPVITFSSKNPGA